MIKIEELHPQLIEKDGKKEFVVLPYAEYNAIKEILEDNEDLLELREEKIAEENKPTKALSEVSKELEID